MARPQKNTVDYFPFYCDEGKKMFYLEETYGNDGFATFLKILRELAKTEYHYLDLSKNTTKMFLSAKCKVSKEVLESIINDLVDLEKFDSILWKENSIIWCQDFIDGIQDAYSKRTNECITRKSLLTLLDSLGIRKLPKQKHKPNNNGSDYDGKPQTILNYIKLYKTKEGAFEEFWILYNKKKDRKKCFTIWKKIKDKDIDVIFETLPKYIKSTPDVQFRKNPSTYLNGECWNDEVVIKPPSNNTTYYEPPKIKVYQ